MNWDLIWNMVGAGCFLLGSLFSLAAAIGMLRFPDLTCRLHAASKPQVVGLILMMLGLALSFRTPTVVWTALLVVLFQMVTAPISAHLAGRAGYRTGQVDTTQLVMDEYRRDMVQMIRDSDLRQSDISGGANPAPGQTDPPATAENVNGADHP